MLHNVQSINKTILQRLHPFVIYFSLNFISKFVLVLHSLSTCYILLSFFVRVLCNTYYRRFELRLFGIYMFCALLIRLLLARAFLGWCFVVKGGCGCGE